MPKAAHERTVFVIGGTGYLGSHLIPVLIERGHRVRALIHPGSTGRLPGGCEVVSGNALDSKTYRHLVRPADTLIHLEAASQADPESGAESAAELVSGREAVSAVAELGLQHFVYLSVAHPAPLRKHSIAAHAECERLIQERHLNATILRPWYVLGPEHRWPYALLPVYKVGEWLPFMRPSALRLGLVTLQQMVLALATAVETPVQGTRILEVPEIRAARLTLTPELVRQGA